MVDKINDDHLVELVEQSGICPEILSAAGVFSADENAAKELVGQNCSGIVFPYMGFREELLGYRLRKDRVEDKKDGKYRQKKGSSLYCFLTPESVNQVLDVSVPLYIVEGEKKALAVRSVLPDTAVVAVPGCWNWTSGGTGTLAPMWSEIPYQGRKVIMVIDSDYFFNPNVNYPYNKFAKELMRHAAHVDLIDLRSCEEVEVDKIGADDFIVKFGRDEFIKRINNPFWTLYSGWSDFQNFAGDSGYSDTVIKGYLRTKVLEDKTSLELGLDDLKKITGVGKVVLRQLWSEVMKDWNSFVPKKEEERVRNSREVALNRGTTGTSKFFSDFTEKAINGDKYLYYLKKEKCLVKMDPLTHEPFYMRTYNDFRFYYSQRLDFIQYNLEGKSDGFEVLPALEMKILFNSIEKYADLKYIDFITDIPIYYKGEIISEPGYNKDLRVYYVGTRISSSENGCPTINHFLNTFPFEDDVAKINALGGLLQTTLFRQELQGERPLILFLGNGQNLGKTTCANCIGWIALKQQLPSITYNSKDDEFEKRLGAAYRQAPGAIIDNVKSTKTISSACLERFLTDSIITTRKLGKSENLVFPNVIQSFLTVNDAKLSEDLFTRSLLISMSESQFDKMPHDFYPMDYVKENREVIISELIYLVEKWISEGQPEANIKYPKYRRYASLIGGILESNGYNGFLSNYDDAQVRLDHLSESILDVATYILSSRPHDIPTEEMFPSQWRLKVETFAGPKLFDENQSFKGRDSSVGRALHRMANKTFNWQLASGDKVKVQCFCRKNSSKVGGNYLYSFSILAEDSINAV